MSKSFCFKCLTALRFGTPTPSKVIPSPTLGDVLCFQLFHRQDEIQPSEGRTEMAQLLTVARLAAAKESLSNFGQERTKIRGFLHESVGLRVSHDVVGIVGIA